MVDKNYGPIPLPVGSDRAIITVYANIVLVAYETQGKHGAYVKTTEFRYTPSKFFIALQRTAGTSQDVTGGSHVSGSDENVSEQKQNVGILSTAKATFSPHSDGKEPTGNDARRNPIIGSTGGDVPASGNDPHAKG